MLEPSLFGIGKAQWELVNSFANWLSAIGTLAAVCVSLYLANRLSTPKAKVSVGLRIILGAGAKGPAPEYVVFRVVNTGERPLRITQIGWKLGLWKKRYAIQMYEASLSSTLPVDLAHGQEAQWFIPTAAREVPWPSYFAKGMLMPNYRSSCFTLRAQVFSSVGHVFKAKPEGPLLSKLREACEALAKKA